jgi:transcriptional regulator with XRE-family HTH domain
MAVPNRDEVHDFLTTRRAKVRPDQVELPTGGNRRGAWSPRTEVAMLAGVSMEYYTRLERGNLNGVSESVLDGIARALQLDDAEGTICSTSPAQQAPHRLGGSAVAPAARQCARDCNTPSTPRLVGRRWSSLPPRHHCRERPRPGPARRGVREDAAAGEPGPALLPRP